MCYTDAERKTRRRELEGLIDACNEFSVKEGYLITSTEEENITESGVTVKIIPAYKFLLTQL